MNRAPTSIFIPPIRRESQHGSSVRRAKHKHKTKKSRNLVTNLKKIIQQINTVKRR